MSMRANKGFTIVELLIVIVVIGILAAIVIVAYNGVQQRASNTQVITGVQAYQKALMSYAQVKSAYPANQGCLGANYPEEQCWKGDSGNQLVNATLDSDLSLYIPNKPTLSKSRYSIGITDNMRSGALYRPAPAPQIVYYLQGSSTKCIDGSSGTVEGSMKQCTLLLPAA